MITIKRFKLNPSLKIVLGFVGIILLGTLLLCLPFANQDGQWLSFVDSLFTSTSAVCVTGLVVVDTTMQFTLFGKIVILMLIQIGGFGIIAITSMFFLLLRKKIGLNNRLALQESMNKDTIQGVVKFIKKTIIIALLIEAVGVVCLLYSMITISGSFWMGLFYAIFMSISAFCNAGFDILGSAEMQFSSLNAFSSSVTMLLPLMFLIVIGGIGFVVIIDGFKNFRNKQHTKVVLWMTGVLILGGAIIFLIAEWNNPNTMGNMSVGDKIMNSFFQSISPRTAGISTIDQGALSKVSLFTTMVLMFIGGSPNSTAGGLKTTAMFILLVFIFKSSNSKGDIRLRDKKISRKILYKVLKIFAFTILVLTMAIILIGIFEPSMSLECIVFECISAISTVGLTMGITPMLCTASKLVVIALMFVGRVGLTTVAMAIASRNLNVINDEIDYTTTDIVI